MLTALPIQATRQDCAVSLVEDDDDLRRNLKVLLEMRGFKVQACATASEFYRDFAVRATSTVVLDIGLDGEDGLSICGHLREHHPLLGIVMVTARSLQDDRMKGLLKGADAYLVKPIDLDELVITLNRLDARFHAARAQASAAFAGAAVAQPVSMDATLPALIPDPSYGSPTALSPIAPTPPSVPSSERAIWRFDGATSVLIGPNGKTRRLVGNDRTVVCCMARKLGLPTSIEELGAHLMIPNTPDGKRRIEVILSRLRRNAMSAIGIPLPLYLLRGTGYFLRDLVLDDPDDRPDTTWADTAG